MTRRVNRVGTIATVFALLGIAGAASAADAPAAFNTDAFPPWQSGANNPAQDRGLEFTVHEADNLADFHGDLSAARLILYVGGNYFFAMAPLVAAFEQTHPDLKGKVYYETIPPGLLARQMKAGGRITVGNMSWTAKPDAYFAGKIAVQKLIDQGDLVAPSVVYATNQLAIMVAKGNPAKIRSLSDLGRPDVVLSMPNPEFEGVARQVKAALAKAGGDDLVKAVYETKVKQGTTLLTRMHHRQTPVWLMEGRAQAGVTWRSETIFQTQRGLPTERVDIPDDQNVRGIYAGAVVKDAPHPDEARMWLAFLRNPEAQAIFARYGFEKPPE